MATELYTFGSGDIRLQIWYDPQKETSLIAHPKRFIASKDQDGSIYGRFEICTVIYKKLENVATIFDDIFENEYIKNKEIDIVVFPKKSIMSPLMRCDSVKIKSKKIKIAPSSNVTMEYFFSNRPDWKEQERTLKFEDPIFNYDSLYKISRSLEESNSILENFYNKKYPKDGGYVLSIEEYTDLKLHGKVPERYKENTASKIIIGNQ